MKTFKKMMSLMMVSLTGFAFVQEKVQEVIIKLPTLKCSICVKTVMKAIQAKDGVQFAEVDKKGKIVTIKFDPLKIKQADLERAIANAGYTANEIVRDSTAYENLDACCK